MIRDFDIKSILGYIDKLPLYDDPELFGLNQNANIISLNKTS